MERPLYTYKYVHLPFETVVAALRDDAGRLFEPATEAAVQQAHDLATHLQVQVGGFEVGRDVTMTLGSFTMIDRHDGKLPIAWQAADHRALFPCMRGQLEVSALSTHPPVCQLTFSGTYTPPLGAIGMLGDTLMGHRVAEAAVHTFLEDVANRISQVVVPAA